jgi:hypothetical protein
MYNSTFNPSSIQEFEKSKLNYAAKGNSCIVPAGTEVDLDLIITDDMLITGAWVITIGSEFGDTAKFQVIDIYGVYTGTPGTVLNSFIEGWNMVGDVNIHMDMQYPAKIYAGLALRLKYTSFGATDVKLAANWKLHKVLI